MEDDLKNFKMEDDLKNFKMEHDLNPNQIQYKTKTIQSVVAQFRVT